MRRQALKVGTVKTDSERRAAMTGRKTETRKKLPGPKWFVYEFRVDDVMTWDAAAGHRYLHQGLDAQAASSHAPCLSRSRKAR
jgi:hypothetical protein